MDVEATYRVKPHTARRLSSPTLEVCWSIARAIRIARQYLLTGAFGIFGARYFRHTYSMRAGYPLDTLGLGSEAPKLPGKKKPRQERRGLEGWRF